MKIFALTVLATVATVASASAQFNNNNRNNYNFNSYGTGANPNSNYVQPHYRNNGDYVGGHYRTNPNSTTQDNYSTRGNLNPYTGSYGRRNPY